MIIFADDIKYAVKVFPLINNWKKISLKHFKKSNISFIDQVFNNDLIYTSEFDKNDGWKYLFLTKYSNHSQFDLLNRISKETKIPGGIICLSDSGREFHGHRNRAWAANSGNLHMSVYLSPQKTIEYFHVGFTILSAISVVQTIDSIPGLKNRAGIKWVNDILIDDSKISGVIAQTESTGNIINNAVLGIGLNIENNPTIKRTSFVKTATSLDIHVTNKEYCSISYVFEKLVKCISDNYKLLLNDGYPKLLEIYRKRSIIIGKNVEIYADPMEGEDVKIAEGKVKSIGNNLELYLENAQKPVNRGRLIMLE